MEQQQQLNVRDVAIYLRKSRDETSGKEDVLAKHEALLLEFAKERNLKYELYKEIGSAELIQYRPEMRRLLEDVEQDLYDAVLVVDIDRLGRGDEEERGRIKRILRESNTLAITPTRVYDFNNEEQSIFHDIEMIFANYEYKMIKKRLMRGKKRGAIGGNWVNGKPPYPYIYNKIDKVLEVDEEQLVIYDLMKKMLLNDRKPCYEIAHTLNRMGSTTVNGRHWSENQIYRLLTSEVHLGKIIYGKTVGSFHKDKPTKPFEFKDRSQWIIKEGSHQQLKTYAEHEQIMAILESRKIKPRSSRTNVQVLSKVLFCGKCGGALQFLNGKNGVVHIKTCQKRDPFGVRCLNRGANVEVVYAGLENELELYEEQLMNQAPNDDGQDNTTMEMVLDNKKAELQDLIGGLDRIEDLYIDGKWDKAKYDDRIDKQERKIRMAREEIANLEKSLAILSAHRTSEERLEAIKVFKDAWNAEDIDNAELNRLARALVDRIEYIRDDDEVRLNIKFL